MNKRHGYKYMCLVLLATFVCIAPTSFGGEKSDKEHSKPGYSVDGRTSASVLAAKRSHEVSKEDEIGLSVFSGLFVIAVIGFFSQKLFEKK